MKEFKSLFLLVPIALLLMAGAYYFKSFLNLEKEADEKERISSMSSYENKKNEFIKVSNPTANSKISSPVSLSGEARGTWFFEGSFPVFIVGEDEKILGQGYVQASSEWMTEEFVEFEGKVEFDPQGAKNGFIQFTKDNPSGMPENDEIVLIPVVFK